MLKWEVKDPTQASMESMHAPDSRLRLVWSLPFLAFQFFYAELQQASKTHFYETKFLFSIHP